MKSINGHRPPTPTKLDEPISQHHLPSHSANYIHGTCCNILQNFIANIIKYISQQCILQQLEVHVIHILIVHIL